MESLSVLMVCMGNICRSPTAEGVLRHLLQAQQLDTQVRVDSAGTHAYHVGEAPDTRSQIAARQRGIELSGLRARLVVADDFKRFDYVLAMDESNLRHLLQLAGRGYQQEKVRLLLDFAPQLGLREVPDPYYGGAAGFERVLDLVEAASLGFIEHIRRQHLR